MTESTTFIDPDDDARELEARRYAAAMRRRRDRARARLARADRRAPPPAPESFLGSVVRALGSRRERSG